MLKVRRVLLPVEVEARYMRTTDSLLTSLWTYLIWRSRKPEGPIAHLGMAVVGGRR